MLRWWSCRGGLQPRERGGRPFTVVRAEGRTFPTHRCLVPASEFRHRSHGKHYSFAQLVAEKLKATAEAIAAEGWK